MSLYDESKEPFSLLCSSGTQIMIFDGVINRIDNKKCIWTKDKTAFDYLRENDIIQRQRTLEKYVVVGKHKEWLMYIELMPYSKEDEKMTTDYLKDVKITKEQREKIGNRMCELSQVGKVYIPSTQETKERVILDFREVLDFLDSIMESDDEPKMYPIISSTKDMAYDLECIEKIQCDFYRGISVNDMER